MQLPLTPLHLGTQINRKLTSSYRYYYDCFFTELALLGETGEPYFTFEELKKEYDECYPFGFSTGMLHAQVIIMYK